MLATQRAADELLGFKLFLDICTITGFTYTYPAFFFVSVTRSISYCDRTKRKKSQVSASRKPQASLRSSLTSHATVPLPRATVGSHTSDVITIIVISYANDSAVVVLPFPPLRTHMCLDFAYGAVYPGMPPPFFTATRLPSDIACSEKAPLAIPVNLVVLIPVVFKQALGRGKTNMVGIQRRKHESPRRGCF